LPSNSRAAFSAIVSSAACADIPKDSKTKRTRDVIFIPLV